MNYPTKAEQDAHWKRQDDLYEAYLADLHRRQQDPEYIASYSQWLKDTNQTQMDWTETVRQMCEEGDPRY